MSDDLNTILPDKQPPGAVTFAGDPVPRCPCLLLPDTSGSMAGQPNTDLNAGIREFYNELQNDSLAMLPWLSNPLKSASRSSPGDRLMCASPAGRSGI